MYAMSTAENYKVFFYIHSFVSFGFGLLSCLLLFPYENLNKEKQKFTEMIEQNNIDRLPENIHKDINKSNSDLNKRNYKEDLKLILNHYRIYYLLCIFLFTSFLQGFILTVGFNFGTMPHGEGNERKIGGDEMSIIFMIMSLTSCFLGPIFGAIYDKLGFKKTMILINIISAINGSLIFITVRLGVFFYGISIILNGALNSGAFSMIFPYVSKIFGFQYAGELYGIVVLSVGISSILSSSIYYLFSKVIKTENDLSYLFIFCVGIILNMVSIWLTYKEKEEGFSFYRVNFLQENINLEEKGKDNKDDEENHSETENSENESTNHIYELEDKSNINSDE
jgi:Na+/melibiose symporter-like transporter